MWSPHRCPPRQTAAAFFGALLLGSLTAAAAELPGEGDHVQPCRPTVACTAEISAPGQLEIEAGVQHKSVSGGRVESAPLLAKLSLTTNFQLQLGTDGPTYVSGDGAHTFLDAAQVLGKVSWKAGDGLPTLGATAGLNLPTQVGARKQTDALFALLASQDLAGFHADLNLGLNLLALNDAPLRQEWGALSISHDLPLNLTGMVEGWHATAAAPLVSRDGGFLFALAWSPLTWVCLDAGGDIAVFGSDRHFSAFAGLTFVALDLWGGPERRAQALAAPAAN